jgi:hypothetical protein
MVIYTAWYECKFVTPIGLPGYNNILLGLPGGNGNSDILLKGTAARFVVGKEYLISIMEKP